LTGRYTCSNAAKKTIVKTNRRIALQLRLWILFVLSASLGPAGAQVSKRPDAKLCLPRLAVGSDAPALMSAGKYRLVIVQTMDKWDRTSPERAEGWMTLVHDPSHWSQSEYYGFASIILIDLDIPLGPPAVDSRDPDAPGIVVTRHWSRPDRWLLWIGTASNAKPRTVHDAKGQERKVVTTDGKGIVLVVEEANESEILGTWGRAGIVGTGRGHFCAFRVADADLADSNR
jgi:hypothetical protein